MIITLDNRRYSEKPQKTDYPAMNNRILEARAQKLTLQELKANIEKGAAYIAGQIIDKTKGRTASNIHNINIISLDVDNSYIDDNKEKAYTSYTKAQAIETVYNITGAKPFMVYETFTGENSNGSRRFRLIYKLAEEKAAAEIQELLSFIIEKANGSLNNLFDTACKDAARIFQGTNKQVEILEGLEIKQELLSKLKEEKQAKEAEKQERTAKKNALKCDLSAFNNDLIDYIKALDISDYLINLGYTDIKKTAAGYKMPCPIHKGKHDNFVISNVNGVYLWKCFSKCDDGGSLIDLHSQLHNVSAGQAIAELCEIYNINENHQAAARTNKEALTIDKYISDNKSTVKAILKAISDYKKVLITAPMGAGKTYFINKHLFQYAKANNKKLIQVIPSIAQLESLADKTPELHAVYSKMPIYQGQELTATTPESLPKILKELEPESYILVIDETHERYTSLYRTGYRNKNIEAAEAGAFKVIHTTATPRILFNDDYNKVIDISSKEQINDNITVKRVIKDLKDVILEEAASLLDAGKQVILFNNNKEINNDFTKILERKAITQITEIEEGQINLFTPAKKITTQQVKVTRSAEAVQSGKVSKHIVKGTVKKDFTATTSTIMAGLDLETEKEAVLLVNARELVIDNLIQLIGRFRKGIEVIIYIQESKKERKFFDMESTFKESLKQLQKVAEAASAFEMMGLPDGAKSIRNSAFLYLDGDKWRIDETALIASIYRQWSAAAYNNREILKTILENQKAFTVSNYNDLVVESSNLRLYKQYESATDKEIKETVKKITDELKQLEDEELTDILNGCRYNALYAELKAIKEQRASIRKHFERINEVEEMLFNDEPAAAFKHYFSNKWAAIKKEIKQERAKSVNKYINTAPESLEFYNSIETDYLKSCYDVMQAQIRYKLQDIEKKRGRITKQWLNSLTYHLVINRYLNSKAAAEYREDQANEEAFRKVREQVKEELHYIYNLDDNKITSAKA